MSELEEEEVANASVASTNSIKLAEWAGDCWEKRLPLPQSPSLHWFKESNGSRGGSAAALGMGVSETIWRFGCWIGLGWACKILNRIAPI